MRYARKDEDEIFPIGFSFKKAEAAVIGIKKGIRFDIGHKMEDEYKRSAIPGTLGELTYRVIWTIQTFDSELRAL